MIDELGRPGAAAPGDEVFIGKHGGMPCSGLRENCIHIMTTLQGPPSHGTRAWPDRRWWPGPGAESWRPT